MSARLSSADTAWLHMDRPTNLMVINTVLLFDEPVDWERVKELTQRRLIDRYPRFRQRVAESRLPLRAPKWEDDPDFALEHHMHHLAVVADDDRHRVGRNPPKGASLGSPAPTGHHSSTRRATAAATSSVDSIPVG